MKSNYHQKKIDMRTKEELLDRYESLYRKAVSSKDVKRMKALGDSERWAFSEMARVHPDIAETWLSQLEGMEWDNYLSEKEAMNIGKRITNQDGSKGFHWNRETFAKAVESLGGKLEEKPSYNDLALWVTANMIYSDHAKSIAEDMGYKSPSEVPAEKMAKSCYSKAIEMLKDPDGGFNIRKYFKRKMYDDSPM